MKVKLTSEINTPLRFIAAGEVVDLPTEEAKALIDAGMALKVEPVKEGKH